MLKKLLIICSFTLIFLNLVNYDNVTYAQIQGSKISNIKVELNSADFVKSYIDKLYVSASGVDFSTGRADSVDVHTFGYHKNDLIIDEINITLTNISFVTEKLISNQELVLNTPVNASGNLIVTEKAINSILNQPKVLDKFSNLAETKISKFGIPINAGMISFYQPRALILQNNRLQIDMMASLANILTFPVKFTCTVTLTNSRLMMSSPELVTSGITLPDDISQKINDKLNSLLDMNSKLEDDLDININSLQMIPRQKIILAGSAKIKKLNFGRKENNNN